MSLSLRASRHPKCLDILFITNIHNLNLRIHHTHIKGVVKKCCQNDQIMANQMELHQLLQSSSLFHGSFSFCSTCLELASNSIHIIWQTCIQNICKYFPIVFLKWLVIVFLILFSTRSNKHKKLTFVHDPPTCSSLPTTSSLENPKSKARVSSTCDARLFSSSLSN